MDNYTHTKKNSFRVRKLDIYSDAADMLQRVKYSINRRRKDGICKFGPGEREKKLFKSCKTIKCFIFYF